MTQGRVPWRDARELAFRAGSQLVDGLSSARVPVVPVSEGEADGCVLAEPVRALTDLPPFDTCAMDGWVVCGPGPWQVLGQLLAGESSSASPPLHPGEACAVTTGAMVPIGADGLVRAEHGSVAGGQLRADAGPLSLRDVRLRGSEATVGEVLVAAGTRVTPPLRGLAAAAGHDCVRVLRRLVVEVLVAGGELVTDGVPVGGQVRDSLGPQLPGWIAAGGGTCSGIRHLGDDADSLDRAVRESVADVLVTTGGSSAGQSDHVRTVLGDQGAQMLVDGVAVRPGSPMKLARLPDGRLVVALPGNPLAALAGVVTLLWPLLAHDLPPLSMAIAAEPIPGPQHGTALLPLVAEPSSNRLRAAGFTGSAMLRGIATATALGVVPPQGIEANAQLPTIPLPW